MECFDFFVGMLAGVFLTALLITVTQRDNYVLKIDLRAVGIDRIEKCHNVHSNWCEIVWSKEAK